MAKDKESPLLQYALWMIIITLGLFLMYQGRVILIPLSFAMLISFMYYPLGIWIERRMGRMVSILVCLLLLTGFGFLLAQILINSSTRLYSQFEGSKDKVLALVTEVRGLLDTYFGITPEIMARLSDRMFEDALGQTVPFLIETVLLSGETIAVVAIIPILTALILHNRELLVRFAMKLVPRDQAEGVKSTVTEVTGTYFRFAKGMLMVYLVVAILNTLGFLAIGLPNALYFGVLASLLTFFPYVGIFIGGSAAVIVAWTTFETLWPPLAVVGVLTIVQYLEANVIFPMAVGRQLKVNSLATLVVIFLGGLVWGGAGMVLFPPLLGILKVLADRVSGFEALAELLGPNGRKEGHNRD